MSPSEQPSAPWRFLSAFSMLGAGLCAKIFVRGLNKMEVHGLDDFVSLLDQRRDVNGRERGLLTVSNHISISDDPLMWSYLPFRLIMPRNMRWTLGAEDICFRNSATSFFFSLTQLLPTHRLNHSPYGGIFQPTMTEAVRLLSDTGPELPPPSVPDLAINQHENQTRKFRPSIFDPFSSPGHTYSTTEDDLFPAPSSYPVRRFNWLHIFPEARVHQHPARTMRYFHWGIARLILEPEVCPAVVPVWVEGFEQVFHEARSFPRPVPRIGKRLSVSFGQNVGGGTPSVTSPHLSDSIDAQLKARKAESKQRQQIIERTRSEFDTDFRVNEGVFADLRARWRLLVRAQSDASNGASSTALGELNETLRTGPEAIQLRIETALRVRQEVLRLRRQRGLPDEDPKQGWADTWRAEGPRQEGGMRDGSWVGDA